MKFSMRFRKGVTLIELLIVISIIGIMTGISIVSLSGGRIEKELQAEANHLVAIIREAQNNALTGKQPTAGTTVCGWGLYVSTDDPQTNYIMYYNAESDCLAADKYYDFGASPISGNYSLKNGVKFDPAGITTKDTYFTIPHATPYEDGLDFDGNLQIQLIKGSRDYYVCVYQGGVVEAEKNGC